MNMKVTDRDIFFMKRALRLAAKARGRTSPNPMVGAIIVKNGKIIAEDYHKKPGELHAEALAILKAQNSGLKTQNSILYVTLEPCCHTDKRTPPCTKAIIDAGIKKVFVAMKDPNHRVSGKGIEELKRHGIKVISNLLEGNAKMLNEAYIKYITTKMPFVILKTAMTLDGKIATPEGQSRWITGEKARKVVHQMRSRVDAVMTAIGTVKADNSELTARIKGGRSPKRIVIDPNLEASLDYKVFNIPPETIVVTKKSGVRSQESEEKKKVLIERGIKIIEYEGEKVNLKWLMQELGNIGITSLMIEAGSSFNASALNDRIVDKVVFFIAPKIIGGKDSITPVGGNTFQRLEDAYRIRDAKVKRIGEDWMIEGYLNK